MLKDLAKWNYLVIKIRLKIRRSLYKVFLPIHLKREGLQWAQYILLTYKPIQGLASHQTNFLLIFQTIIYLHLWGLIRKNTDLVKENRAFKAS